MTWRRRASRVPLLAAFLVGSLAFVGTASADVPMSTTVELTEQNGSGMTGTAVLTDMGNGTTMVQVQVDNAGTGPQPIHIHMGTCDNLDPKPQYPLTNLENGMSETTVNASLASLMDGNHAINVHKSSAEVQVYVACGNIEAMAANVPAPEATVAPAAPTTTPASAGAPAAAAPGVQMPAAQVPWTK
jgi:hypothetical protein